MGKQQQKLSVKSVPLLNNSPTRSTSRHCPRPRSVRFGKTNRSDIKTRCGMEAFRGVDRRPKTYGKKKPARPYLSSIFDQPSPKTYRYIIREQDILEDPSSAEPEMQCLPSDALHAESKDERGGQPESSRSRHRPTHHSQITATSLEEAFKVLHIARERKDTSTRGSESPILRARSPNAQTTASHHLEVDIRPTHRCRAGSNVVLPSPRKKDVSTTGIPRSVRRKVEEVESKIVDLRSSLQPDDSGKLLRTRRSAAAVDGQRGTRQIAQHRESNDPHSFTRPLLDLANDPLSRQSPVQFQAWANELQGLFEVEKIAEASYGEVYRLKLIDRSTSSEAGTAAESVLKVIPLKPEVVSKSRKRQAEQMSAVEDVFMEVQTLMRMSVIPGFTNFRDLRVMEGRFPTPFVKAWKGYIRDRGKSYLPDPGNIRTYPKSQLWAVIEMENAGMDLEKFPLRNFVQTWDIFWGVAMALAKGEDLARFEVSMSHSFLARMRSCLSLLTDDIELSIEIFILETFACRKERRRSIDPIGALDIQT